MTSYPELAAPPAIHLFNPRHARSCPWIDIPDQRIICIEHPAAIKDVQRGIATLGGEKALVKVRNND